LKKTLQYKILSILIAAIWFINGLFCKILNFVPRHEQIVARILGEEYSEFFTILIGISEILMAIWILSKFLPKFNVALQIMIIISMNILEFLLAPDLLLWGKANIMFALLFSVLIYYHTFILKKQL
jgi:uncharacterized membrane protein YphA (DoxX/SURF4 family)